MISSRRLPATGRPMSGLVSRTLRAWMMSPTLAAAAIHKTQAADALDRERPQPVARLRQKPPALLAATADWTFVPDGAIFLRLKFSRNG